MPPDVDDCGRPEGLKYFSRGIVIIGQFPAIAAVVVCAIPGACRT
jgi:hypothetical protein